MAQAARTPAAFFAPLAGNTFQPTRPEVVFESLDDTQPLPLRHQGSGSFIKRKYRMADKEISGLKFLFGVPIGNQNPLIKPKRQPGIGSVSWQYVSLWVFILPVRSQYASDSLRG